VSGRNVGSQEELAKLRKVTSGEVSPKHRDTKAIWSRGKTAVIWCRQTT
jgi:hypothetical protein